MPRLTDGERDIMAELEADARDLATAEDWDEEQREAEQDYYQWLATMPGLPTDPPYSDEEIEEFCDMASNEPPY